MWTSKNHFLIDGSGSSEMGMVFHKSSIEGLMCYAPLHLYRLIEGSIFKLEKGSDPCVGAMDQSELRI
ncbi:hypothetical protein ACOSP7_001401 [Xanthoceras sorbifolium]